MVRIGLGYDLHTLVEGRPLILGGIHIPFEKGEAGHSDGDVLLHALADSLLGAACLGDIGELFPPSDPRWEGADSRMLLQTVWQRVRAEGWQLENADCVIAIQKPKILPYREAIRRSIAEILSVGIDQIFVKAKPAKGLVLSAAVRPPLYGAPVFFLDNSYSHTISQKTIVFLKVLTCGIQAENKRFLGGGLFFGKL